MANKPRVICHKERFPRKDATQFDKNNERFMSADDFLKEFSFSIESDDSKRFTNNFVDPPKIPEFSSSSYKTQLNSFPASSLQDLTVKSDIQLPVTQSGSSSSLKLVKNKQQSLTDITTEIAEPSKRKTQRKPVSKPRHPPDSVKRDRRTDGTHTSEKRAPSRGKTTPPSEFRSKSRNTTQHKTSMLQPDDSHVADIYTTPLTHPHKQPHIEVTLPLPENKQPGLSLELQNALLLSAVHLNLSTQKAYTDTEKEALIQLSKLRAYKQKLQEDNFKLRKEEERLEYESMAKFALDELGQVEEVLAKLNLAGAQMHKLSEALIRAQSTVRLHKIHMSERDREQCEKNLSELSSAATHSLTNMRSLLGQVSMVCDKVQKAANGREEDLKRVREANEKLEEFASIMLSKVSLQSHAALLEENIALMKDPDKYFSFDFNEI